MLRLVIGDPPHSKPQKTNGARSDECPVPAPSDGDPWYDERRQQGPDVRARVEQPCRERPFTLRKPLGDDLDRRRKIPCLTKTKREARDDEPCNGGGVCEADEGKH